MYATGESISGDTALREKDSRSIGSYMIPRGMGAFRVGA